MGCLNTECQYFDTNLKDNCGGFGIKYNGTYCLGYISDYTMMDKEEAIKWFKEIQNGSGVSEKYDFPDNMKGSTAKGCWDDPLFDYGIEYGILIALKKIFNITKEDLIRNKNVRK